MCYVLILVAFREIILNSKDYLCRYRFLMNRRSECYQHELQLNGVFFISTVVTKAATYPVGLVLDRYGPRLVSMIGCVVFAAGCLMLAASNLEFDWLHYTGYSVLAIGGVFVYMPSLQMCRIVPKLASLMMALMTSAFDVSAIVFHIIKCVYEWLEYRFSVQVLLMGYLCVPLVAFVLVTSFYPSGDLPTTMDDAYDVDGNGGANANDSTVNNVNRTHCWHTIATDEDIHNSYHRRDGQIRERTMGQILGSLDFWVLALFTGCMTCRFAHYLSTFHMQMGRSTLEWKFQRSVLTGFTTFFPLGGFISLTAVGQLLQSFSLATNTLLVWSLVVLVWGPIEEEATRDLVGASVVLCSILRPYYYSVTNQLCERLFGATHHGRVYGLILSISAIVNLLTLPSIYDGFFSYFGASQWAWHVIRYCGRLGFLLPLYLYYLGV